LLVDAAKKQAALEIRDENGKVHFSQTFQLKD
jgi:alkaline phosphatase D